MRVDLSTGVWLEIFNGAWSILAFSACVFLIYHIHDIAVQRRITLRRWFVDLPQSMQLAVAVLAVSFGVVISRAPIWWWRIRTGGDLAAFDSVKPWLIVSAAIGCVGFACLIRVITRPMKTHLPWIVPMVAVLGYAIGSLWVHAR